MPLPKLLQFLDNSPTAYHAASEIKKTLISKGYSELLENESWNLEKGRGYFIQRSSSSVAAFVINEEVSKGFKIIGSHTDSPLLKLKIDSENHVKGGYRVRTETYGGPILSTWFDRKLIIAGRVSFKKGNKSIEFKNVVLNEIHAYIPNLAIHLNREVNKGVELNKQNHLNLLVSSKKKEKGFILNALASQLDIKREDMLMCELFAVPAEKSEIMNNEFIISGRIDNLSMCYVASACIPDLNKVKPQKNIMSIWYDSEEIGNRTRQGGASSFLDDILKRLSANDSSEAYYRCKASSFLISADGAHAVHPSYQDKHDADYSPEINRGPVVKMNAGRAYATDVDSGSILVNLMTDSSIPYQKLVNRSDLPTGSTIGPIVSTSTGINTVDMGIPMLGMHSAREICGIRDIEYTESLFNIFWN